MRTRLAYTFAAMTNSALTDVDALTPAQFVRYGQDVARDLRGGMGLGAS